MERTLVLLKPDAVQRNVAGKIISRIEDRGLKIVGIKMIHMDQSLAGKHYGVHQGKPFFEGLVNFITSSPIIAIAVEGLNAVEVVRNTMGTTDPAKAQLGTIRGDMGLDIGRNLVHGSDSISNAETELSLFFDKQELIDYKRNVDPWIIEEKD